MLIIICVRRNIKSHSWYEIDVESSFYWKLIVKPKIMRLHGVENELRYTIETFQWTAEGISYTIRKSST